MAAGLGFKTFTTGEVLTAADTNGYLMQGVLVFASAAARDAAITSPQEGQCCYLKDTDAVLTYSGAAWVGFDDSNAIQNSIVDAKGDLVAASGADTPARLAVGSNDLLLTAASGEATGLKYTGAWTSYTPTYSAGFVIGNGSVAAKYQQVGKLVTLYFFLTWGTTTAITNFSTVSLPVTGVTDGYFNGTATYTDSGVANYQGTAWQANTTTFYFLCPTTNTNFLGFNPAGSTSPATFNTGDAWRLILTYEVA